MLNLYTKPTLSEMSESLEDMPIAFPGSMGIMQNVPHMSGMPFTQFSPSVYAPIFVQAVYIQFPSPSYGSQPNTPVVGAVPDIFFQKPLLGKVTKSPEDALDSVLSSIFPNGYDRDGNLFDNGIDSVMVAQITVKCAEEGYRIGMEEIFADPTFTGIVSNMKTE